MFKDFTCNERMSNLSEIRQGMVNSYLRTEHTHVLMIDADVDYSAKTVIDLMRTSEKDIVAPAVLGEGEREGEWYDTFAFIDVNGIHAIRKSPFFQNESKILPMMCVGTMYFMPADLFREGASYYLIDGFTEHLSVCLFALKSGRKVLCNQNIIVRHPRLNDFGETRE